jgi:hypothetical protein
MSPRMMSANPLAKSTSENVKCNFRAIKKWRGGTIPGPLSSRPRAGFTRCVEVKDVHNGTPEPSYMREHRVLVDSQFQGNRTIFFKEGTPLVLKVERRKVIILA